MHEKVSEYSDAIGTLRGFEYEVPIFLTS